jgi:LmeA-like phospholipid-binding
MRKLLLLLLAAAVLVGADFAAARLFESKVTTALARKYQLGSRLIVQVRDFPFLPHLLTGHFSGVDLAATDARAQGLDLSRVEVQLRGVRVPRTVLFGGHGLVRVDRAEGQVELSQDQINRLLAGRLRGGAVSIGADGLRLGVSTDVLGQRVDAVVAGRLAARDGRLAFQPQSVEVGGMRDPVLQTTLVSRFTFDVPLPRLPADIQVERVTTEPGAVVLAGRADAIDVAA